MPPPRETSSDVVTNNKTEIHIANASETLLVIRPWDAERNAYGRGT